MSGTGTGAGNTMFYITGDDGTSNFEVKESGIVTINSTDIAAGTTMLDIQGTGGATTFNITEDGPLYMENLTNTFPVVNSNKSLYRSNITTGIQRAGFDQFPIIHNPTLRWPQGNIGYCSTEQCYQWADMHNYIVGRDAAGIEVPAGNSRNVTFGSGNGFDDDSIPGDPQQIRSLKMVMLLWVLKSLSNTINVY